MDRILPPPPVASKPRNETMNAHLPTYRNRPSGSSSSANPASHFANAKSLFESLNTPAVRNGVSQLAKNPLAQRAAVALAKNDTVRTTAVNAAQKHATGKEPDPLVSQMANVSIRNMVKEFESKPIMGMSTGEAPAGNRASQLSMGQANNYEQTTEPPTYKNLTAIDPFEYPPQLPSTYPHQFASLAATDSYNNRSKSTEPFGYGALTADLRKKTNNAPPSRPPPPKMANSWSNPSLAPPADIMNRAHALARYPYKAAHMDELSFEPGDTLLLEREVDNDWVAAVNTRTGLSGIVPLTFMDIKIPLAPSSSMARQPSIFSAPLPQIQKSSGGSMQVMKALYDYHSGVDGDLAFNAGDLIVVHESVGNDWFSGQLQNRFGIFPASYVQPTDGSSGGPVSPPKTATVTALYDYASEVADDLQFRANDTIEIVEEVNAEWIRGRLNGRVGLVPMTYVQRN